MNNEKAIVLLEAIADAISKKDDIINLQDYQLRELKSKLVAAERELEELNASK